MNNYAELFPILRYKDGVLTRINGSGNIIGGHYALLPLFSVNQESFCKIETETFRFNGLPIKLEQHSLKVNIPDLPDPCFLVATRYYGGYTTEELEKINVIWNNLMSKL